MNTAHPATPRRWQLSVMFAIYVVLLAWIVLWKLQIPYVGIGPLRAVKIVPFVASGTAGASAPLEVLANLLFFLPFGLYLGLLVPSWHWWRSASVIAGASLLCEVTQYLLKIGSADVSDVIANTTGGLIGIGLLAMARRAHQAQTEIIIMRICVIGTILGLLAAGLFLASPVRYAPPRDVWVSDGHQSHRMDRTGPFSESLNPARPG